MWGIRLLRVFRVFRVPTIVISIGCFHPVPPHFTWYVVVDETIRGTLNTLNTLSRCPQQTDTGVTPFTYPANRSIGLCGRWSGLLESDAEGRFTQRGPSGLHTVGVIRLPQFVANHVGFGRFERCVIEPDYKRVGA
jgi:hypothetical protein